MKKIIAILLVAVTVVAMVACGPKGGGNSGGGAEANKDHYGTWTCVKLESLNGALTDEVLEATRQQMAETNLLFYFEFGDKSYMYNPDGDGGYNKVEIVVEMDQGRMYAAENESDEVFFEYKDGQLIIDETGSGIRFFMGRE